jgi:hypothetical protein
MSAASQAAPSVAPFTLTSLVLLGAEEFNVAQKETKVQIHIDHDHFTVTIPTMTGQELRTLPEPDIGPDRDLFLKVPGPDDDQPIGNEDPVELKNGMHFFTAPATITPGGHASADRY